MRLSRADQSGPPTVLRTALAAWDAIPPSATHHLIVQDDMLLSATLFQRARLAIEAMPPQAALALFSLCCHATAQPCGLAHCARRDGSPQSMNTLRAQR